MNLRGRAEEFIEDVVRSRKKRKHEHSPNGRNLHQPLRNEYKTRVRLPAP
jgi:hypothetical protein